MRWAIGLAGGAVVALLVVRFAGRDVARVEPDRRAAEERVEKPRHAAPEAEAGEVQEPPTRTIETRVVDAETREPVEGARVRAYPGVDAPSSVLLLVLPRPAAEATTGPDGGAMLAVPDGPHVLMASAPGYAPGRGDAEIALKRGVTRTFRVVDEEGRAVPTATGVVFQRDADLRAVAPATADGRIVVTVSPRDELIVRAPGYATERVKRPARFDREVVLRPEFRIEGRVVDEAGAPVAAARIELDPPFRPGEAAVADSVGAFAFGGLGPHTYTLRASAEGFLAGGATADAGDEGVRIVLSRPHGIAGVVVFPDGSPAVGARVRAGSDVATDAGGRFRLSGLAARLTTVVATHGHLPALPGESFGPAAFYGYARATPPADDVRIELQPQQRSFARLRVVDTQGRPAPGWWPMGAQVCADRHELTLAFPLPPGREQDVCLRNNPRRFRISVRTYATPNAAPWQTVVVPDAPRATLVVRLPDGSPLPASVSATIELGTLHAWPLGPVRHDRITFGFNDLSDATDFSARVSAPGFAPVRRTLQLPEPGGTVEVQLRPGAGIRGVALRPDGMPLRSGWVDVWVRGQARERIEGLDAGGAFRIDDLPAGEAVITLGLRDEEMPLAQVERTLEASEVVDLGAIRLVPVRKVRGRVLDAAGEPLAGVALRVFEDYGEAVTRADGSFLLRVPPHAAGFVVARKPGYGTVGVPLERAAEIRMRRGGTIRLTMRRSDPPDARVRSWSVGVRAPGARWHWQPEYDSVEREEGRWVRDYRDLPPGPLEIYVATMIGDRVACVDVVAGKTVGAELEVP